MSGARHLGIIRGLSAHCFFAGDMCVVADEDGETLFAAFQNALDCPLDQDARLNSQTLKRAMAAVGRRLNDDEALRLVKSFDTDANGSIDYHEFVEGFKGMVGMELPHGLGVESYDQVVVLDQIVALDDKQTRVVDGQHTTNHLMSHHQPLDAKLATLTPAHAQELRYAMYEGQIFEDKRFGISRFTSRGGHWYLGQWVLGVCCGSGIEGLTLNGLAVPLALVTCRHDRLLTCERFDANNDVHVAFLRRMSGVVDHARKRATKAHRLLDQQAVLSLMGRKLGGAIEKLLASTDSLEEPVFSPLTVKTPFGIEKGRQASFDAVAHP